MSRTLADPLQARRETKSKVIRAKGALLEMSHRIDQPHLSVIAKFIESRSSWQNGRVESFNDTLRDKLLNREIFDTRAVDQTSPDAFTWAYNTSRHHASLSYESPDAIEKRFNLRYNQVEINLIG